MISTWILNAELLGKLTELGFCTNPVSSEREVDSVDEENIRVFEGAKCKIVAMERSERKQTIVARWVAEWF